RMNHFGFIVALIFLIIIWSRLVRVLGRTNKPRSADSVQAAVRRVVDLDSFGAVPAARAIQAAVTQSNQISNSSQETHMNPVSALIFIVFVGGAVLSYVARMPIGITILLALIGIFLGYSVKMAQQWEKAVVLRLGKLHAVKGPGLFILV